MPFTQQAVSFTLHGKQDLAENPSINKLKQTEIKENVWIKFWIWTS